MRVIIIFNSHTNLANVNLYHWQLCGVSKSRDARVFRASWIFLFHSAIWWKAGGTFSESFDRWQHVAAHILFSHSTRQLALRVAYASRPVRLVKYWKFCWIFRTSISYPKTQAKTSHIAYVSYSFNAYSNLASEIQVLKNLWLIFRGLLYLVTTDWHTYT